VLLLSCSGFPSRPLPPRPGVGLDGFTVSTSLLLPVLRPPFSIHPHTLRPPLPTVCVFGEFPRPNVVRPQFPFPARVILALQPSPSLPTFPLLPLFPLYSSLSFIPLGTPCAPPLPILDVPPFSLALRLPTPFSAMVWDSVCGMYLPFRVHQSPISSVDFLFVVSSSLERSPLMKAFVMFSRNIVLPGRSVVLSIETYLPRCIAAEFFDDLPTCAWLICVPVDTPCYRRGRNPFFFFHPSCQAGFRLTNEAVEKSWRIRRLRTFAFPLNSCRSGVTPSLLRTLLRKHECHLSLRTPSKYSCHVSVLALRSSCSEVILASLPGCAASGSAWAGSPGEAVSSGFWKKNARLPPFLVASFFLRTPDVRARSSFYPGSPAGLVSQTWRFDTFIFPWRSPGIPPPWPRNGDHVSRERGTDSGDLPRAFLRPTGPCPAVENLALQVSSLSRPASTWVFPIRSCTP